MKPMMANRYVGWMAVRPLQFGDEQFAPGDRVPQKHLDGMRDPEVLLRTRRIAAVAKDMNKVPRYLRKDVTEEIEMRDKILAPRVASQVGEIIPRHLLDQLEVEVGAVEETIAEIEVSEETVVADENPDLNPAEEPADAPVVEVPPVEAPPAPAEPAPEVPVPVDTPVDIPTPEVVPEPAPEPAPEAPAEPAAPAVAPEPAQVEPPAAPAPEEAAPVAPVDAPWTDPTASPAPESEPQP